MTSSFGFKKRDSRLPALALSPIKSVNIWLNARAIGSAKIMANDAGMMKDNLFRRYAHASCDTAFIIFLLKCFHAHFYQRWLARNHQQAWSYVRGQYDNLPPMAKCRRLDSQWSRRAWHRHSRRAFKYNYIEIRGRSHSHQYCRVLKHLVPAAYLSTRAAWYRCDINAASSRYFNKPDKACAQIFRRLWSMK